MAGKTPGIRLPDIHRGIPAPAFGNHTQLEVGLGTPYFCRVGTGKGGETMRVKVRSV